MVNFTKISEHKTLTGQHFDIYLIDFDAKGLGEYVKEAFIKSEQYPFKTTYGDLKIALVGGKPVLIHEYDTSG